MSSETPPSAPGPVPSSKIYQAFMSYSHAADGQLAPALQSALQRFAKPWYQLRALHVFRDTTTLAVTPSLWSAIQAALDQSSHFILLASPESAASVWVQREIEYWLGCNPATRMLIVLTGGALVWDRAKSAFDPAGTTALPQMLMGKFPDEPLYLDLRWAHVQTHLSLSHPVFRDAVAEISAGIRGCAKDEIIGEDIRQHTRTLRIGWSAIATLGLLTMVSIFAARIAFQQRSVAEAQRAVAVEQGQIALARQLAAQSTSVRVQFPDRLPLAVLLAAESARLHPSFEGNQALREASTLLPRPVQSYEYKDSGGQERVRALSFSPDGVYVAVARDEGTADIFEPGKPGISRTLRPDEQKATLVDLSGEHAEDDSDVGTEMTSLAFSPDGRILATASNDGTARLWQTASGRELLTIQHGSHVVSVAFSPDGKHLATGSADGKLRLFAVAPPEGNTRGSTTGPSADRKMIELQMEFKHGAEVRQVMFSPNGQLLAAISTDGGISLSGLARKESRRVWSAGVSGLGLAFSQDGKRVATANGSRAYVWDVATGRELFKAMHATSADSAESPLHWVDSVALSPDANYLASAGRDGTARVWNLTTGQELIRLTHGAPVEAVAFSRDGGSLSTGSFDGTARLWELPSGRELLRATHPGGSEVVAFSPDGKQIASGGSEGAVNVWSLSRSDQVAATTLPDVVSAVRMSPSGDRVATADNGGHLRIWSSDGRVEYEANAPARGGLVFSENGHFLAGTASDSLFVMDVAKDHTLKTLATFRDARDYASSTRYLAGIARDMKHIRIWETAGGGELPPVEVVDPQAIKFDPTGSFLAIKQLDNYGKHGAIRVRDVVANQERQLSIEGDPPREFALGPRGRIVALSFSNPNGTDARRNDYVEVRDVNTGQPLAHLVQDGSVDSMQFDPSGTRLVVLTEGNAVPRQQIDVWDWGAGQMRARLFHEDEVSKVRFSDHSSVLAALSAGRVYVWDYFTGALQSQLADAGYVQDVRFSADGRYILTGGNDGTAAIWLWRIEDLRAEACKRLTRNLSSGEWQQYLGTLPYHATCLLPKAAG